MHHGLLAVQRQRKRTAARAKEMHEHCRICAEECRRCKAACAHLLDAME